MLIDQQRLADRVRRLKWGRRRRDGRGESRERLQQEIERSIARRQQRLADLPRPTFPDELPIVRRRAEIARAIAGNQVVIVCGETGSGKTTQLPKICMELGRGVAGMIGHTQPRRIAARSVATRIAAELQSPLGKHVGYKVRFSDKLDPSANLKIMTDGILLAETQGDRDLFQYDTIIIDEAHERSLNIDFLLGYLKQLLPRRPDLKVIITSATIDPESFSRYFGGAPVIEVSGRGYPVETRYRPVQGEEDDEEDPTVLEAILAAVNELCKLDDRGDILIFLSGEREIRETAEALRKRVGVLFQEVLALYARLSFDEQQRVFEPHEGRRIVLATNVAETSLTVPGIRFVIDPGLARISRYSANARVQRLPIERISQASADQRRGRCGRTEAGMCIRLYSETDFAQRPRFTDPEILRSNLASVILQMKALKLGEVERFDFLAPPRPAMIREGYQTLHELGAIDERGQLTAIGAELARLPIDPRIGRMILAARHENCLTEALIIASGLATQDPRLRPLDAPAPADAAHAQFADERSDFLVTLNIWNFYHSAARELSSSKLRKLCQQNFLSYVRLREWHDVHRQLVALTKQAGMKLNDGPASYERLHRALLTGLLSNVGLKSEGHEYLGVRERGFNIFPGSTLFKAGPKWIVAGELVETARLYGRTIARIQPEWIEQLAGHLLKRAYTAPYWNPTSAHVEAFERVTLHGLTIVPKRRVHFGKIDPVLAREVFIQHALVEGEFQTPGEFLHHNLALMSEVRAVEAKTRRRDVMVERRAIFDFYDRRVPAEVFNGPLFEKWRRGAERANPGLLFMSRDDLVQPGAAAVSGREFPDALMARGAKLPLEYRLDPGGSDDGVTLVVPREALHLVTEDQAEWLVPGLLRDKVIALLKTLPKEVRRNFVPAPDFADACLRTIAIGEGSLLDQLSQKLVHMTGIEVPRHAWTPGALPDHLRMNFRVIDGEGATLAGGRDLTALKQQLVDTRSAPGRLDAAIDPGFGRYHMTSWDFGDLPERVPIQRGGVEMYGYPALIDDGESVSLALLDSEAAATRASRTGLRRLFVLAVRDELGAHIEYLPGLDELGVRFERFGGLAALKTQLVELAADRAFLGEAAAVRTQNEFERRLRSGWNSLWPAASAVSALVERILELRHDIDFLLHAHDNPFFAHAINDVRLQLERLMPANFLLETPFHWLEQFPRYLQAIELRMRKLTNAGVERDRCATAQLAELWTRYETRVARHRVHGIYDPSLEHYRWMIEELRVSLFAQGLGTSLPISPKRMEKQWSSVAP